MMLMMMMILIVMMMMMSIIFITIVNDATAFCDECQACIVVFDIKIRVIFYVMCQGEYLISRIFTLLLVSLKRAYFPRFAVSHKCFMVSGIL